jgi:hypothetical protein
VELIGYSIKKIHIAGAQSWDRYCRPRVGIRELGREGGVELFLALEGASKVGLLLTKGIENVVKSGNARVVELQFIFESVKIPSLAAVDVKIRFIKHFSK